MLIMLVAWTLMEQQGTLFQLETMVTYIGIDRFVITQNGKA